jgi:hypothetical protein
MALVDDTDKIAIKLSPIFIFRSNEYDLHKESYSGLVNQVCLF